ncbi:MAG: DegT/DnrJ/EryC1/StrS family aminotransferase [Candidatus Omnitrophota bacterium]
MIICADPLAGYLAHRKQIDSAVGSVLASGRYILGEQVKAFETEFAGYIGVKYAVSVGNGTDALRIALCSCGIKRGDEVITVSHTAVATVAAIELAGGVPVLVDIDPFTMTLDPSKLEKMVTKRTKAVIVVHLYGCCADLSPIIKIAKRYGLRVIEDCAQAHGAFYKGRRAGSWGDLSCFSFYPTKNLGAIGDGGMILTDRLELAEKAALLREYGWEKRYESLVPGGNSRLDELQAAILRVKLKYLDSENKKRLALSGLYNKKLKKEGWLVLPEYRVDLSHVYHLFVVRCRLRDRLQGYLKKNNIFSLVHYPVPVHLQKAYFGRLRGKDDLKETENAAKSVLSLPIYPQMSKYDLEEVAAAVHSFKGGRYD